MPIQRNFRIHLMRLTRRTFLGGNVKAVFRSTANCRTASAPGLHDLMSVDQEMLGTFRRHLHSPPGPFLGYCSHALNRAQLSCI